MRIAELIEGEILDSSFERVAEPCVDKSSACLEWISLSARECDEVDGVIVQIVEARESCDWLAIVIGEPLTYFLGSVGSDSLVVLDVVALVPVLHSSM